MIYQKDPIRNFEWKDLHKKIVQIIVVEPNPEVLEFYGQVYACDDKGNVWVLHEWEDK